jgi:hypothetical protein
MKATKIAVLQALKDAGEVGPEGDKKKVMAAQVGVMQALKDLGITMPENVADNPELDAIPYKEAPEDIKRQMEAKAGLTPSQEVSPVGVDTAIKEKSAQEATVQSERSHQLSVAQFAQSAQQAEKSNQLQEKALKQKGNNAVRK